MSVYPPVPGAPGWGDGGGGGSGGPYPVYLSYSSSSGVQLGLSDGNIFSAPVPGDDTFVIQGDNSANKFAVKNDSGMSLLNADTTGGTFSVGPAPPVPGLPNFGVYSSGGVPMLYTGVDSKSDSFLTTVGGNLNVNGSINSTNMTFTPGDPEADPPVPARTDFEGDVGFGGGLHCVNLTATGDATIAQSLTVGSTLNCTGTSIAVNAGAESSVALAVTDYEEETPFFRVDTQGKSLVLNTEGQFAVNSADGATRYLRVNYDADNEVATVQTQNNTLDNGSGGASFRGVSVHGTNNSRKFEVKDVLETNVFAVDTNNASVQVGPAPEMEQRPFFGVYSLGADPILEAGVNEDGVTMGVGVTGTLNVSGSTTFGGGVTMVDSNTTYHRNSNVASVGIASSGELIATAKALVPGTANTTHLGIAGRRWGRTHTGAIETDLVDAIDVDFTGTLNNVTATEVSYLSGATSNIQDQIDSISGGGPYLPLTGGTISGNLTVTGVPTISGDQIILSATNPLGNASIAYKPRVSDPTGPRSIELNSPYQVEITASQMNLNTADRTYVFNDEGIYGMGGVGRAQLGTFVNPYDTVFVNTAPVVVSDRNKKADIEPSSLGLNFINNLQPSQYRMQNGQRTHYGLIAQDVEQVIQQQGMSSQDFAGLVKNTNDGQDHYALRYEEFIAPLIKSVQELSGRVDQLQQNNHQ